MSEMDSDLVDQQRMANTSDTQLPAASSEIAALYVAPSEVPQIVAQWADDTLGRYSSLSNRKGKGITNRSVNRLISHAPSADGEESEHFIFNAGALEIAVQAWSVKADADNNTAKAMLHNVGPAVHEFAHDNWREMTHEQLADLFRVATTEGISGDIAVDALKGYFEAPTTTKDAIDLKYTLAEAAVDLIDNPQALFFALMVGLHETDILPRAGTVHINHVAVTDGAVHETELHHRGVQADIVLSTLAELIEVDLDKIIDKNVEALRQSARFNQQLELFREQAKRALGMSDYAGRIDAINEEKTPTQISSSLGQEAEIAQMSKSRRWAFDIYEASADPLALRYAREVGSLVGGQRWHRKIKQETGIEYEATSIFLPQEGVVIDLYVLPGTTMAQGEDIYHVALDQLADKITEQQEHQAEVEAMGMTRKIAAQPLEMKYAGAKLPVFMRPLSEFERRHLHPLQNLARVGFPLPSEIHGVDSEVTMEAIELLKEDTATGSRFAGRRPIRFMLRAPEYRNLGYTHIDLIQDPNTDGLIAYLFHNKTPYEVKIDGDFNLNADNKILNMPGFVESLHYVILRQYEGWANDYEVFTSEGKVTGDHSGRVHFGKLVFLPEGENFTQSRADAFRAQRPNSFGGDLAVASEVRRATHPRARGRSSTYREEKYDKSKPPLVVDGRQL